MPGNRHDGETAVAAITEQKAQGLTPPKVIADAAYGDGIYRKNLKEEGTQVVAPLKEKNDRTKSIYSKNLFQYDQDKQTLTCPQGVTTKASFYDRQRQVKTFHFLMSTCNKCPVQKECTNDKDGRRTVGISQVYNDLMEAERYNLTEQFKEDMKLRPPIEGKLAELIRYHGLRRARYRGLSKVSLQCYFTAVAVNIKRWVKILIEKMSPKTAVVAVS
jgi:transposase